MFKELFSLFFSFVKIGTFTLGGGYAMIPLIQREVVDRRKWVEKNDFLDLLALAQSAPGPMAVNTSIMVGYKIHKAPGALAGFLGSTLPSFVIILVVAIFFSHIDKDPVVISIFKGIRPAVVALILHPVFSFAKGMKYWEYALFIGIAAAIYFGASPVWFLAAAIAYGVGYTFYLSRKSR